MKLRRVLGSTVLAAALLVPVTSGSSQAATLPTGFAEQIVFSGLNQPTNMEFAPDGRIFVAQKNGVVKVFDSLTDQAPDTFADLSAQVNSFWDRGLLGLALPPDFPASPYVYVLYTYDAKPGGSAPTWGDTCPSPPGDTADGCVVTGRLSRLKAAGNHQTGPEEVLVTDWCQQYPSHSVGDLAFGPDGYLYASAGDGASFNWTDYGQDGSPVNPCGDPGGAAPAPPSAEGGALRSQDVRTTADPAGLDGTIIRIDPATGAGVAGNPYFASTDANARRIVSYGLRNPFRMSFRPGTGEIWAGDVGWSTWEEINRVTSPATAANFGWPCHEGAGRHSGYDGANLTLCESLYTAGGVTSPYYAYNHGSKVVAGESCPSGGSSVTGIAFYPAAGEYPAEYNNALFFSDYNRGCIWAMQTGANGLPDPTKIKTFVAGASGVVDLEAGPGGDLYYADLPGGTIRRIRYFPSNQPPVPAFTATPSAGPAPLTVAFDGAPTTDPDPGEILTYKWDFDNNGTVDATGRTATFTYTTPGTRTAKLTVTDSAGVSASTTKTISPGESPPVAVIDTPAPGLLWKVGDTISFTGHGTDTQDGTVPASRLAWQLILHHCYDATDCHSHFLQEFTGTGGSFTAPDHEYPSHLELKLTATDSAGLSSAASVRLDPRTVNLTFATSPAGLQLTVGSKTQATPFTRTVIQGSANSISAPTPQAGHAFGSWSDGGAQTHVITASGAGTYTAAYTAITSPLSISGRVLAGGVPLAGALVTLTPGGQTTTASATGDYSFTGIGAAGTYGVTASLGLGRCVVPATASVIVDGAEVADIAVTALRDGFGYTCHDATRPFVAGSTVTGLTGDDRTQAVSLPFTFPFYGQAYTTATVDTNGVLSFGPGTAATAPGNVPLPAATAPNAAVYPFWRDLGLDTASAVLTTSSASAFTVEWRNAYIYGYRSHRINFSVTLHPNGDVLVGYQYLDARATEQGGGSTVGIENETGTVGLQYSHNEQTLRDETSILFVPTR
ncbi:PQQ-dependent sugar dehydrogenase [Longispora albida]|uniref:PQQ-dependent sugar dehydrogenase n=1 Tax=Longispora albida TaxID=203523 RepID=UPI0003655E24|nr:PQQ-dependent sugar dehydrogenase [Longispora albida]